MEPKDTKTFTMQQILDMEGASQVELLRLSDEGAVVVSLDVERERLEEVWLDYAIDRLSSEYLPDLAREGFVGMGERSDLNLVMTLAWNRPEALEGLIEDLAEQNNLAPTA